MMNEHVLGKYRTSCGVIALPAAKLQGAEASKIEFLPAPTRVEPRQSKDEEHPTCNAGLFTRGHLSKRPGHSRYRGPSLICAFAAQEQLQVPRLPM